MDKNLLSEILQKMIDKRETELKNEIMKIIEFIENNIMIKICGSINYSKKDGYVNSLIKMEKDEEINNSIRVINELNLEIYKLKAVNEEDDEFNSLYIQISSILNIRSINI